MNKDITSEDYWLDYYGEQEFNFDYEGVCYDIVVEIGEELKRNSIKGWMIIDGYIIEPGETYPEHHVWIEFDNGSIIDVCCIEFFGVDSCDVTRVENYHSVFHEDGSEELFVRKEYGLNEYLKYLKWLRNGNPVELI